MQKIVPIFIVGIIVAIVWFVYSATRNSIEDNLPKRLDVWGVSINQAGFLLTNFSETSSGGLAKETLEAEFGLAGAQGEKVILKITRVQTAAPQKYIDDKKFLLESLFLPTTSPYPGVITNIRECPNEFKPIVQETQQGTIYTLFAGARFNYGVCAKDLVEYYSMYGIFDCLPTGDLPQGDKEKGIFEIRLFSKAPEQLQPLIESFACG